MAYIRFLGGSLGKSYHGTDDGRSVNLFKGIVSDVSDTKKKQLISDFPGQFEEVKKEDAEKELNDIRKKDVEAQIKKQRKLQGLPEVDEVLASEKSEPGTSAPEKSNTTLKGK